MNDVGSGSVEGAMELLEIEVSDHVALGGDQQPIRESRGPLLTTGDLVAAFAALLEPWIAEWVLSLL